MLAMDCEAPPPWGINKASRHLLLRRGGEPGGRSHLSARTSTPPGPLREYSSGEVVLVLRVLEVFSC